MPIMQAYVRNIAAKLTGFDIILHSFIRLNMVLTGSEMTID